MKRLFILLIVSLLALVSCDREYVVEHVDGIWQMSNASLTISIPGNQPIEASSTKELFSGVLGLVKAFMPEEDFSETEAEIAKMEDTPFSFTEEQTFRLEFKKDGTFCSWAREDNGKWTQSESMGEYSYAGYRLTMYSDNEDGTNRTIPGVILKLTNKQLVLQLKLADLYGMPVSNPLNSETLGSGDDEEENSPAMYMALLSYIDVTTDLYFNKVKK